jgi:hypothetical protein
LKPIHLLTAPLAVLAIAACSDTQAPDQSPTTSSATPKTSLPVMTTMRVAAPAPAATGAFTITLRFINPPTVDQRAFFETAAADRYHVSGRQERVAGDVTSARLNLGGANG